MLKGWLDRVLIYGEVYASKKRSEKGRFVGKRAMLSLTVGTSQETYAFDGRSGDIDLLLWPVNFSLAYVGYTVLSPFIAYGVEGGLRYSEPSIVEARLRSVEDGLCVVLNNLKQRAVIPFNQMAEWSANGRIKAEAAVYSPFIWTYVKQKGKDKGKRFPVTYSGLPGAINTAFRQSGITDFKIHDLRHDFASKLLRRTSNLALVKDTLAHSDIKSTLRYAHVLGDDIARGMEGMTTGTVPERGLSVVNGKKAVN